MIRGQLYVKEGWGDFLGGGFMETVVETLQNVLQHETKAEHRSILLLFIFLHIFN